MVLISKGLLLIRKFKVVTHVFRVFEASTLLWLGKNNVPCILIIHLFFLSTLNQTNWLNIIKNIISPIFFPQSKRLLRYNVYKNFNMLRISVWDGINEILKVISKVDLETALLVANLTWTSKIWPCVHAKSGRFVSIWHKVV